MNRLMTMALLGALSMPMFATTADAGIVARACLDSNRDGKSLDLCNCIQRVANARLSRSHQKLAAKFFEDPHKAQEVRQSDNPLHAAFWERYKVFGEIVAKDCRRYR